jgi:hypothetical protein
VIRTPILAPKANGHVERLIGTLRRECTDHVLIWGEAHRTTRLTLVHDEFPKATATYEQCLSGWPVILSGLKTVLETGRPLVMPS